MKEKVEAVQRMQDYIAAHLSERITLADLAAAAYFSPFYSARIFRELTGLAPADYIRRKRLSESALRLRDVHCRVIDAALDCGFGSVDGYQRAFFVNSAVIRANTQIILFRCLSLSPTA